MKRIMLIGFMGNCWAVDWSVMRHLQKAQAKSAYMHKQYQDAQKRYEQLVINSPQDYETVLGMANTLYAQADYQQALRYYRLIADQLSLSNAQREMVLFNAGCAQVKVEQLREALASFEAVVKLNVANARAKKNVEILKKMLDEQQKQSDKKEQNNDQSKKQTQQSSNDQPSNTKNNEQQEADKNKNRDGNKTDTEHDKRQGDQAGNQKNAGDNKFEQPRNTQGAQQQNQNTPHNERAQPQSAQSAHNQSPAQGSCPQSSGQPSPAQCKPVTLDKQSQDILREIAAVEKEGHKLYVQALAGQRKEQEGEAHAW